LKQANKLLNCELHTAQPAGRRGGLPAHEVCRGDSFQHYLHITSPGGENGGHRNGVLYLLVDMIARGCSTRWWLNLFFIPPTIFRILRSLLLRKLK